MGKANRGVTWLMTNDEIPMTNQCRNPNDESIPGMPRSVIKDGASRMGAGGLRFKGDGEVE